MNVFAIWPALFAETDIGATATLVAAVTACLAAFAASLFAYLTGRDKLHFDADTLGMKAEIAALTKSSEECEKDRKVCREQIAALETKSDLAEKTAARMEGTQLATEHEMKDLRDEVRELRDRLYSRKK